MIFILEVHLFLIGNFAKMRRKKSLLSVHNRLMSPLAMERIQVFMTVLSYLTL
jgi:hypothetical protein